MKRVKQLVSLCLILVIAAAFCAPVYGDQSLATSTDIPVTGGQEETTPTATPVPSRVPIITPPSAATAEPTATPTAEPTATPTAEPTATPTTEPTATPTAEPTATPTAEPTATPTAEPTATPTAEPTATPTAEPTATPTATPTAEPTATPTAEPTATPTAEPTATPTAEPTATPTAEPTATPAAEPIATPTAEPTATPTAEPTATPTAEPTATPEPTAEPDTDASTNGLVFEIVDDHAVVVGYTGDADSVTIPAEYAGVPVTVIGSRAFEMASVSSVTLPSTIEVIENSAFQDCILDSINLPEGLVSIGSYAFSQSCLPSYTLPSTLRYIGDGAFYCNGGNSLVIPVGVTSLGEQAFQENGAKTVVIHAPLTELPFGTFIACRNLTSVTLPSSMTHIGKNAFAESGLTSFTVPAHISSIGDVAFSYCEQLETVTVLNPEASFGNSVFTGSDNVTLRAYASSTAQAYAEANGIPFEALEDEPTATPEILVEVVQSEVLVDTPATIYVTIKGAVDIELGYMSDRYGYKTLGARSLNGFPGDVFGVGDIVCDGDTATITYYPWDGPNNLCVKATLSDNEYIYSEVFSINGIFHGTLNTFECYIDMDELPRVGRDIVIRWEEPAHAEYYICQVIMPDGSQYVETVTDACLLIPSRNVTALGKMEVTVQAHAAGFFYNSETIRPYIYGNIPLDSIIMPDTAIRRQDAVIKWNPSKENGTVWGTIYMSNDQWPYGELNWSTMTHTNGADADGYVHIQFNKNYLSRPGTYTYYFVCDESSSGNGDQYISDTYTLHVYDPGNGDYYYDAWNTGARLSGYVGSATEVTIPDTIAGVPVVNIEQSFYYDWMLTSINIPDTIGELNGYTFRECTNLREVRLPSNLMRINSTVFGNCDSLQEISIPASVEEISGYVFNSCDNLRKVIIYSRNVKIDRVAFNACPNVTLYGYLGSTTEAYAKANNIPFVPLDGEAEEAVAFTMDKSTALVGEEVTFVITAPGATELKLLADAGTESAYEETFAATGDETTFVRAFSKAGARSIQFSALVNGAWTEPCEAQTLTLTSLGQLGQPVVTVQGPVYVNEAFAASWTAVENAQSYALHVTLGGVETWAGTTADTSFTIPGTAVATAGDYCLLVQPVAVGYSQNEGSFTFAVMEPGNPGISITRLYFWRNNAWDEGEYYAAVEYVVDEGIEAVTIDYRHQLPDQMNTSHTLSVESGNCNDSFSHTSKNQDYYDGFSVVIRGYRSLEDAQNRVNAVCEVSDEIKREDGAILLLSYPEGNDVSKYRAKKDYEGTWTYHLFTQGEPEGIDIYVDDIWYGRARKTESLNDGVTKYTAEIDLTEGIHTLYFVTMDGSSSVSTQVAVIRDIEDEIRHPAGDRFVSGSWPHDSQMSWDFISSDKEIRVCGVLGDFVYVHVWDSYRFTYWSQLKEPERSPLAGVTFENITQGDILTTGAPAAKWNAVDGATHYLVSLRDLTEDTALIVQRNIGDNTELSMDMLTAGHAYRLWVASVPEGASYASQPELCGTAQVEFSWRSVPAFAITGLNASGVLSEPVTVSWEAPVWPLEPNLAPDYYVVWWYGPGLENGIPQLVAQGDALTSTLPGELTGQPGAYRVAVYACMYDSWAEVHSMTEATFTVAPETDGAITAIFLNERNVTNEHRYTFTGTLTYIVRTAGPASGVNVRRNGSSIGAMTSLGQAGDGTGDWLYTMDVRIPEGVHTLTFVTADGTSTAITNIAGITRSATETTMYTSIDNAQLRTWPATTIGSPVLLTRNTAMLVRGYCGDYAYVQIDGVNRFLLKDHLWPFEVTGMRAGEWFFEVRSNNIFIYSEQMEDNLGDFVLVMGEGSPTADLRTLRVFDEPEHIFTYQPSTRYYNQLFSFSHDLELEEGKQYHFAVIPTGTPVSSVTSFMFSYALQSGSIITSPTNGAWINLWQGEPLELRWRLHDGCAEYTVQIHLLMELPDGGTTPLLLYDRTYPVSEIQINGSTSGLDLTAEDFPTLGENATFSSEISTLRICITAH